MLCISLWIGPWNGVLISSSSLLTLEEPILRARVTADFRSIRFDPKSDEFRSDLIPLSSLQKEIREPILSEELRCCEILESTHSEKTQILKKNPV